MASRIGFHVSISGGISNSVDNALKIGCNTFQIFSRNPRGWTAKPLQGDDVENFRKKLNESKIDRYSVFVHSHIYLIFLLLIENYTRGQLTLLKRR